ncbi:hypothetical protein P280DRAFT_399214 [Massarina eburnea CBS 473.64]|uniref:DNA-binding protein RAP1 n=1 Tax=Massarina eburnea CBS 473.64 TaxID=1395130 RepID=A0A6A6S1T9_9PLEO|nr:hypothetical protein P280DRAFT_399214 [Massarina eburnea CBS 473.64]
MAAPTVYEEVAEGADLQSQLFAGKSFWLAQRVPTRLHLLKDIENNGGKVVSLEKKADYRIADHCRRDCLPGTISYTFIEKSIKNGAMEDPENHRAGPPEGTTREAGARDMPKKGGRAKYTADEDRILYKWVRDCMAEGKPESGNEIYKTLEKQYPQHPWQSWRDRYLKQLRNRPPSAFNIPENAPPSPPTDEPAESTPVRKAEPASPKTKKVSGETKTESKEIELQNMYKFSKEEEEELYAIVEEISAASPKDYRKAWDEMAEAKGDKHSADEWRLCFEGVVKPQWEKDSVEQRQTIRQRVLKRIEESASQELEQESNTQDDDPEKTAVETEEPTTPQAQKPKSKRTRDENEDEDARFETHLNKKHKGKASSAYLFFAREKKYTVWQNQPGLDYTELHKVLMAEWNALSPDEKAPYFTLQTGSHDETQKSPEVCMSSSTAGPETPKYITEAYEKAVRRLSGDAQKNKVEETTPRPAKRQKSNTAVPQPEKAIEQSVEKSVEASPGLGTRAEPFEVSSDASSSQSEEQEAEEETMVNDTHVNQEVEREMAQHAAQEFKDLPKDLYSDSDLEALNPSSSSKERDDENSDNYPSNTPTPRAPRQRSAFDTQAILSSPTRISQTLSALPRPPPFPRDEDADLKLPTPILHPSSPVHDPPSDASTTHSMQEFRRSLNDEEGLAPNPNPPSSRASSPASSIASGDPDPPLTASEIDDFYAEQHAAGFADDMITAALKVTHCRPELTAEVLEAWSKRESLPIGRGIWSADDDEDVLGGDADQLKRLERKHTMDGWGGITERTKFLECL